MQKSKIIRLATGIVNLGGVVFVLTSPSQALACGASGLDGISFCSLAEHRAESRPRWAMGTSGLFTSTRLRFSGAIDGDETRNVLMATIAYSPNPRWTFQVSGGPSVFGTLNMPDGTYRFSSGAAGLLGASWRVIEGREFLILSSGLSFLANRTERTTMPSAHYEALDLRLGAQVGTTIFNSIRPYLPLRAFGGPIFWHYQGRNVTGTDKYHYQVGFGLAIQFQRRLHAFAEGIPIGERAISLGISAVLSP